MTVTRTTVERRLDGQQPHLHVHSPGGNPGDFAADSQLSLTIPAGWTAPQNTTPATPASSRSRQRCDLHAQSSRPITRQRDPDQPDVPAPRRSRSRTRTRQHSRRLGPTSSSRTKTKTEAAARLPPYLAPVSPTVDVVGPATQARVHAAAQRRRPAAPHWTTQPQVAVQDSAPATRSPTDNSTQVTLAITPARARRRGARVQLEHGHCGQRRRDVRRLRHRQGRHGLHADRDEHPCAHERDEQRLQHRCRRQREAGVHVTAAAIQRPRRLPGGRPVTGRRR